jgi:hypothetical protein
LEGAFQGFGNQISDGAKAAWNWVTTWPEAKYNMTEVYVMMPITNDTLVSDILKGKRGSIKDAPLPPGSPPWSEIVKKNWGQIANGAKNNQTGYKAIKKLLGDKRFDR